MHSNPTTSGPNLFRDTVSSPKTAIAPYSMRSTFMFREYIKYFLDPGTLRFGAGLFFNRYREAQFIRLDNPPRPVILSIFRVQPVPSDFTLSLGGEI